MFAQGWEDIECFGKAKKGWLSKFLRLKQGIPPHDVNRRVFFMLKPREVEKYFMNWVWAVKHNYDWEVIAIDGKTVRGSFNAVDGAKAIHQGMSVGDAEQAGVWSGEDGGQEQRNKSDTVTAGDDCHGRVHHHQ